MFFQSIGLAWMLFASCTNYKSTNQEHADDLVRTDQSTTVDTTLHLKFTSGIRAIFEDSNGNLWFGSHGEGVARYDGNKITYFTTQGGLSHNQVRTIKQDAYGKVWFECGKGLSYYDGFGISSYTARDYSAKDEWNISSNDIWFKGDEEIGFNGKEKRPGAYRFDGHKMTFQAFPVQVDNSEVDKYSVFASIIKGKDNTVWFPTFGAVIGYDGDSFTVIDNTRLQLDASTGYLHVRSIFEDSQENLWIGNNGIGVLKYDGDTTINVSKLYGLVHNNSEHSGHASPPGSLEHVFAIAEDKEGDIWFGDRDTGAWRFDGTSFENFTSEDGLTSTHVWTIYKDKREEMWFGLADGSVVKFNGESFDKIF